MLMSQRLSIIKLSDTKLKNHLNNKKLQYLETQFLPLSESLLLELQATWAWLHLWKPPCIVSMESMVPKWTPPLYLIF